MSLVKEVILWGIWLSLSRKHFGELPQRFHCGGHGFNAWSGNPHARHLWPKKKRREKKLQTIKGSLCGSPHHPPQALGPGVRLAAARVPLGARWLLPTGPQVG